MPHIKRNAAQAIPFHAPPILLLVISIPPDVIALSCWPASHQSQASCFGRAYHPAATIVWERWSGLNCFLQPRTPVNLYLKKGGLSTSLFHARLTCFADQNAMLCFARRFAAGR